MYIKICSHGVNESLVFSCQSCFNNRQGTTVLTWSCTSTALAWPSASKSSSASSTYSEFLRTKLLFWLEIGCGHHTKWHHISIFDNIYIFKWPNCESLDDGSSCVKVILVVDVSASTSLHQDEYTTLYIHVKYSHTIHLIPKSKVIIKFRWRPSRERMIVEMPDGCQDWAWLSKVVNCRDYPRRHLLMDTVGVSHLI